MKLTEFVKKYDDVEINEKELCDKLGIKQKFEKWVPKKDENYWYITGLGLIGGDRWRNANCDKFRLAKRNVYQTKQQCQFALDMWKFCQERSFEPNWNDKNQIKYFVELNYGYIKPAIDNYTSYLDFSPFYYPTKEAAQEVIDKYSFEELTEYYGRV